MSEDFKVHSLIDVFETQPTPFDFVIPGLACRTVGALIAPGGTGKSMFALQLACAVAAGSTDANTLKLPMPLAGTVVYVSLEDSFDEIHLRLINLRDHFSLPTRTTIESKLKIITPDEPFDITKTTLLERLIKAGQGARLIIFDTLSDIHSLDENDNSAMSSVMKQLRTLAKSSGAAVLYLHHISKAAALAGQGSIQQAARGASALVDKARWCGNLTTLNPNEPNFVKFTVGKQNYGESERERWYERTRQGVLLPTSKPRSSKARGFDDV